MFVYTRRTTLKQFTVVTIRPTFWKTCYMIIPIGSLKNFHDFADLEIC